MHISAKIQPKT